MKKFTIAIAVLTCFAVPPFVWNCGIKKNALSHYADPFPGVKARRFIQLPVGAVRPEGWLKNTLQAWGDGITGHLHEYRPDTFSNTSQRFLPLRGGGLKFKHCHGRNPLGILQRV